MEEIIEEVSDDRSKNKRSQNKKFGMTLVYFSGIEQSVHKEVISTDLFDQIKSDYYAYLEKSSEAKYWNHYDIDGTFIIRWDQVASLYTWVRPIE